MKFLSFSTILLALFLASCSDKPEEAATEAPTEAAAPADTAAPATETPVAASAAAEPGGYVPTAEEKVEGITMTQEELDKVFAEARANTPVPMIPGEEPAAAPVEATPIESAK